MAGHAKTLNPRQALFAQAVATGKTLTEAARVANYKDGPNLSRIATRLAQQPVVKAEIERLRARSSASHELSLERWTYELMYQYERVRDLTDKHGNPLATEALSALDKWAKHVGAYEAHESSERASEVLTALAVIGQRMIASRVEEKAPLTVEATVRNLIHQVPPAGR